MRIEHVAVYVSNLEKMRSFYCQYFGGTSNQGYENPISGLKTYFLSFSDGSRLELMKRPDVISGTNHELQLGLCHLAFDVGCREQVDHLTKEIKEDGYTVFAQPRITGDGYYESVILDPEGNRIEITSNP